MSAEYTLEARRWHWANECSTCGFPRLRHEGHAPWCAHVRSCEWGCSDFVESTSPLLPSAGHDGGVDLSTAVAASPLPSPVPAAAVDLLPSEPSLSSSPLHESAATAASDGSSEKSNDPRQSPRKRPGAVTEHQERTAMSITDQGTAVPTATRQLLADAPPELERCPGSGHIVRDLAAATSPCPSCKAEIATVSDHRWPFPCVVLVRHDRPKQRRGCKVCGATVRAGEAWCSSFCHRADDPGAYDDSDFDDFDPPWLAAEDLAGERS